MNNNLRDDVQTEVKVEKLEEGVAMSLISLHLKVFLKLKLNIELYLLKTKSTYSN